MKLKKLFCPFLAVSFSLVCSCPLFASGDNPEKSKEEIPTEEEGVEGTGKKQDEDLVKSRLAMGYLPLSSESEIEKNSESGGDDSFLEDLELQKLLEEAIFAPRKRVRKDPDFSDSSGLLNFHDFFGLDRDPWKSQSFSGPEKPHSGLYKPGFRNLGNTCFANAATALLLESPVIREQLMADLQKGKTVTLPSESDEQLEKRREFQEATRRLSEERNQKDLESQRYLSSSDIVKPLSEYLDRLEKASLALDGTLNIGGFDGARLRRNQGDAFDFAAKVMEYLEYPSPGWVKFIDFEDGSSKTVLHQGSGIVSLSLKNIREELQKSAGFSLILRENGRQESMTGENQVENPDGVRMDSVITYGFATLPDSAIFRLERFEWDYTRPVPRKAKIKQSVRMEKNVTLRSFDKDAGNYQLNAVVIHAGSDPSFGHYYTYIWNQQKEVWLIFDDSSVQEVCEEDVARDVERNGYLFLYSREI